MRAHLLLFFVASLAMPAFSQVGAVAVSSAPAAPPASDEQALRAKAQALESAGRIPQALEIYRRLLAAKPSDKGLLYTVGTLERRGGNPAASKDAFLRLLQVSPGDGGALEGLSLAYLQLGEYEKARQTLEEWNSKSPKNAYILDLLARSYSSLGQGENAERAYEQAVEADPADLMAFRRLEDRKLLEPGVFPSLSSSKAIDTEELNTPNPQRIIYEGRSGGTQIRTRLTPQLGLRLGLSADEEAQRNETEGFSYFDVLEQMYTLGLEARPRPDLSLTGEYGESLFSDIKNSGIGRLNFSRAQVSGEWRPAADSYLRLSLRRAPKLLRGAGGDNFFAILRESSANAEGQVYRWGWGWLARGGLADYSDHTTFQNYSFSATKEYGDHLLQPGFSHFPYEFFGATPIGRLGAVQVNRWSLRYRWLKEEAYQADATYGYNIYHDGNRLHDAGCQLKAWFPWYKELSLGYRFNILRYLNSVDSYRSTDDQVHWVGGYWKRAAARSLWTNVGYEHGVGREFRGPYEANAVLGDLEWYPKSQASLKAGARASRNTLRDDSYSFWLQGRYNF